MVCPCCGQKPTTMNFDSTMNFHHRCVLCGCESDKSGNSFEDTLVPPPLNELDLTHFNAKRKPQTSDIEQEQTP
jgi:hypothetical protein